MNALPVRQFRSADASTIRTKQRSDDHKDGGSATPGGSAIQISGALAAGPAARVTNDKKAKATAPEYSLSGCAALLGFAFDLVIVERVNPTQLTRFSERISFGNRT